MKKQQLHSSLVPTPVGKCVSYGVRQSKAQRFCALALALSFVVSCFPLLGQTAFFDNFTNYAVGSFPSAGGWQLPYNGAGNSDQEVVAAPQGDGHAFQLVGSTCWSAIAYHPVLLPNKFTYEAHLMMHGSLSGGCDGNVGFFGIFNPAIGEWGTAYGQITFQSDGNIHVDSGTWSDTVLMPYQTNTWYDIACDYDLTTQLMGVRINGSGTLAQVSTTASGSPTGIYLQAGHAGSPILLIENVIVIEPSPPVFTQQPLDQVVNAGQGFVFNSQATGYPSPAFQWQFSTEGTNFTDIAGATSASFSASTSSVTNIGYYRVLAGNSVNTNISTSASLTFLNLNLYAGLNILGPIGASYAIQSTSNVASTNWVTLTNVNLPTQPYIYIDYSSPANPRQFYRAIPQ